MFKEIFERILRTNGAVVTLCHVASDVAERVQVDIAANGVKCVKFSFEVSRPG